jgi:hypothetical protein
VVVPRSGSASPIVSDVVASLGSFLGAQWRVSGGRDAGAMPVAVPGCGAPGVLGEDIPG